MKNMKIKMLLLFLLLIVAEPLSAKMFGSEIVETHDYCSEGHAFRYIREFHYFLWIKVNTTTKTIQIL